jgi:hypothetical protein
LFPPSFDCLEQGLKENRQKYEHKNEFQFFGFLHIFFAGLMQLNSGWMKGFRFAEKT